jgi:pimeloyl-ACP methyl ester carboxylesterase
VLKEYDVKKITLPNGETLAYREAGEGDETLLLIHGNMSSSVHYDTMMEALEDHYKIYAVDLRGFGDSSYNSAINSLQDFSHDVEQFLTGLDITADAVVGWSTGGGVALELAVALPERVKKVVLLESVSLMGYPMYKKDATGQPILTELIKTREAVANDPVQVLPILNAYSAGDKQLLRTVWNMLIYNRVQPQPERYDRYLDAMLKQRNLVDVDYALINFNMTERHNGVVEGTNRVSLLKTPVLVVQGAQDMVVPKAWGEQTAELLGPLAKLVLLEEAGHSPITDCPDKLIAIIREFVS